MNIKFFGLIVLLCMHTQPNDTNQADKATREANGKNVSDSGERKQHFPEKFF